MEATGFEKFAIKEWEGWDGDFYTAISFYGCDLSPLFSALTGKDFADSVQIDLQNNEVALYNEGEEDPFHTQKFILTIVPEQCNG